MNNKNFEERKQEIIFKVKSLSDDLTLIFSYSKYNIYPLKEFLLGEINLKTEIISQCKNYLENLRELQD